MPKIKGFFFALCICLAASVAQAQSEGRITVTGQGSVFAAPDMAVLTTGASAQAKTAKAAMDATSRITADVLEQLARFEVTARDIQTSDLSLRALWSNRSDSQSTPQIEGYQASNRITVRVRDLDQLGPLLDAVLNDGANEMGGLRFSVADPKPLMDEARRLAVADARAKAELYADAAGVDLGALVSLSEAGGHTPRPEMMSMARASDAGVPVATGETEIRSGVTLVYAIATP